MAIKGVASLLRPILKGLDYLTPLVDLIVRCWIAWIFFKAGLSKLDNWEGTVLLFMHEYMVPLASPTLAAILGTAAELILPVLLVLGLGGRIVILIFFIYNLVAVISYPFLWTAEGMTGLNQHINWALLLAMLMTHGSGKWSLDHLIRKRFAHRMDNTSDAGG